MRFFSFIVATDPHCQCGVYIGSVCALARLSAPVTGREIAHKGARWPAASTKTSGVLAAASGPANGATVSDSDGPTCSVHPDRRGAGVPSPPGRSVFAGAPRRRPPALGRPADLEFLSPVVYRQDGYRGTARWGGLAKTEPPGGGSVSSGGLWRQDRRGGGAGCSTIPAASRGSRTGAAVSKLALFPRRLCRALRPRSSEATGPGSAGGGRAGAGTARAAPRRRN